MKDFFRYDHLCFRYEPFPIGLAKPLLDGARYQELVDAYPPLERFAPLAKVGDKFSLSEKFGAKEYRQLISSDRVWRDFHAWIKSPDFVCGVLAALEDRHIELGFDPAASPTTLLLRRIADAARGGSRPKSLRLSARFEFSMMPAQGGYILPHTDGHSKAVTLVVSMLRPGDWDPSWGGATDVNRVKRADQSFNRLNRQLRFDDVEVIESYAFEPNQAVVFVKTFNSWHSVRPMTGPPGAMRRTLTINIETPS